MKPMTSSLGLMLRVAIQMIDNKRDNLFEPIAPKSLTSRTDYMRTCEYCPKGSLADYNSHGNRACLQCSKHRYTDRCTDRAYLQCSKQCTSHATHATQFQQKFKISA